VPSGNLVATAEEMSRFYDLLLRGGELGGVRVFEPRTVFRATAEQSYFELDLSLGLPLRYSMGFQLGARWLSLFGPYTPRAFGHVGFTNIVTWADPERGLAAAIMTSGKPLIYAEIYYLIEVLLRINRACA
jgi:CubicO group peptidase (beta-lactamase class C family)